MTTASAGGGAGALRVDLGSATSLAPLGTTVTGECTPLHRGRTTMTWQTRILDKDGKLLALVIQTQLVKRS